MSGPELGRAADRAAARHRHPLHLGIFGGRRRRSQRAHRRPAGEAVHDRAARAEGARRTRRSARRASRYPEGMAVISFARGVPAPECLPVSELADCARAAIERTATPSSRTGRAAATAPLREWIAERHGVEPARVLVTSGSLQGFVFLARAARAAGRARARRGADVRPAAARSSRASAPRSCRSRWTTRASTPTRSSGRSPTATKPAFLYTIATFQNPSGRTLSEERRRRVVEIAREHDAARPRGRSVRTRALRGRGAADAVRARGRRATSSTRPRSRRRSRPASASATSCCRRSSRRRSRRSPCRRTSRRRSSRRRRCYEFLRRGNFDPNLERVNGLLKARRDAMLEALERHMPPDADWSRPEGGYFIWLDVPSGPTRPSCSCRRRRPA